MGAQPEYFRKVTFFFVKKSIYFLSRVFCIFLLVKLKKIIREKIINTITLSLMLKHFFCRGEILVFLPFLQILYYVLLL